MLTSDQLDLITNRAKNIKDWSKDAFNCKKCPKNGCPAWWKFRWHLYNDELKSHSEKEIEGCKFVLEPIFMADQLSTIYSAIESTNKITKSFEKIAENLDQHTLQVKQGIISLMKLVGVKDVQRILDENENLRRKLEEKNITLLEEVNATE